MDSPLAGLIARENLVDKQAQCHQVVVSAHSHLLCALKVVPWDSGSYFSALPSA